MKIVIDMNIPPSWVFVFETAGYQAVHWSTIGNIKAKDSTMQGVYAQSVARRDLPASQAALGR